MAGSESLNSLNGSVGSILHLWIGATLFVVANAGANKYYIFNGLFVADFMSHLIKLVSYAAVSAALVYSRQWLIDRGLWATGVGPASCRY